MAAKCLVLLAFVAVASAGMVRRETSPAEDLQKHAAEFQKTFSEQLNSLANAKNTQELNKALKEGSDSVLKQLSSLSASLQKALGDASGKAKETLEKSREDIKKAADDLRKQHPEVQEKAEKLRETLQTAVNSAVQATQNVAKEVATNVEETNKKLAPQIKAAYDDFVKNAQEVQKKLHEAANKP